MSSGRELLDLLDSDLLEYVSELETAEVDVYDWRAICNLLERVSLLRLHAERLRQRHPRKSEVISRCEAEFALIEEILEKDAASTRPAASVIKRALDAGDKVSSLAALPDGAAQFLAALPRRLVANAGMLSVPAGAPELDDLLVGFHHGEPGGRWSGPHTSCVIALPLQALKRAGVARMTLIFHLTEMSTVSVLFGQELELIPEAVEAQGNRISLLPERVEQDHDRILLTVPRVRKIGPDQRWLGLRLERIEFEKKQDQE